MTRTAETRQNPGDDLWTRLTEAVVTMEFGPTADEFDIGRTPNHHMAFGAGGAHFCLGANLAKLEIKIIFEELAKRIPDIHLTGNIERLRMNLIDGIKHMPVEFTPSPALL